MRNFTTKEIASTYTKCIFKIFTYLKNTPISQGSGVLLKNKNIIVTNYHIFIGSDNYKIFYNGVVIPKCKIVSVNAQKDLLLIYLGSPVKDTEEIGVSTENYVGEKVYAFGFPLNYGLTMTEGIVSNLNTNIKIKISENYFTNEINQSGVIQITAPISHGSSGGALVNEKGELLGITTYSDKAGLGINFAIPIKEALGEVDEFTKLKIDKSGFKKLNALDYYCLGVNIMENGEFKQAYKLFSKAYKKLPKNRNLLFNLSIVCNLTSDYKNALKYCNRLIKLENLTLRVINCKASTYLFMGKNKEAIKLLNLGVKHYPNDSFLHYRKAIAYF